MPKSVVKGQDYDDPEYIRLRLIAKMEMCPECDTLWQWKNFKSNPCHNQIRIGSKGKLFPARRAVYRYFKPNGALIPGRYITSRCPNPACCNPELLVQVFPQAFYAALPPEKRSRKALETRKKISEKSRKKISAELRVRIAQDTRPQRVISAETGVSQAHISKIRRQHLKNTLAPASPWSGLVKTGHAG